MIILSGFMVTSFFSIVVFTSYVYKCFFAKVEYIADFAKSTLQKCRRKTSVFLQHMRTEKQIVYTVIELEEKIETLYYY